MGTELAIPSKLNSLTKLRGLQDATEPTQGTFTFTEADQIVNLAKGNGQMLRGHNCVWYNQLPNWVTSGTWTNATLTAAMTNHCSKVVGNYKGKTYSFDVINGEAAQRRHIAPL